MGRACAKAHEPCRSIVGRQAAVLNSCFLVRMGPMAGWQPAVGEAQTAAGVRSRAFLPKTARRCNWRAHFGTTGVKALPSPPSANQYRLACRFSSGNYALTAGWDRWLHRGGRSGYGKPFRPVCPKCARLQRLRRAAGCFGEIAATPNPGRWLVLPQKALQT